MKRWAKVAFSFAVMALLTAAVWITLTLRSSSDEDRTSSSSVTTTTNSAEVSANQAREVAVALGQLATDPDSLVADGSRSHVGQRAQEGVPAGSSVEVDEASWAPDGVGGGTVEVTVSSPGLPTVSYVVVMVSEDGRWKVAATMPISDSAAGGTR